MLLAKTLGEQFQDTLIKDNRYMLYLEGLGNTLLTSLGAMMLGLLLGICIALVLYINKKFGSLKILKWICDVYIYIIRGTPVVLQLMIMYFIVLVFIPNGIIVAIITFGINSGAYVAELFRGGLEAVDHGQLEAGLSLGLNNSQTLTKIIIPQAMRTSLPSLCNEFIALIKETSVMGYIAILDVTFAANLIQSRTLNAFVPLIISAIIYLILVTLLTVLLRQVERRLSRGQR
ncbi:MAG: amino acid ABC transporter permease [Clostridia bacterium]|nr:amino acid ABC transporter permease [Clostridia bacterium]